MRGAKAKAIRREVYGEMGQATVDTRKYGAFKSNPRTIINTGKRRTYQARKKNPAGVLLKHPLSK